METNDKNSSKLPIGIIGAGDIVSNVHLPVLFAIGNLTISWICDINNTKASSLAKAFNIPYQEFPKNLNSLPETDIVLLAIPIGTRDEYYKAFKERSCAIYVEKPFSLSTEHHKKICSYFAPYKLACGLQRRSWGPTLSVKKIIESNIFGEIKKVNFQFGKPGQVGGSKFFQDVRISGGGMISEFGVHGIDTILFCTSSKLLKINDIKMMTEDGFDTHTNANLVLRDTLGRDIECNLLVTCQEETNNNLEFIFNNLKVSFSLFDLEGKISVQHLQDSKLDDILLDSMDRKGFYPLTTYQIFYEHWMSFIEAIVTNKANYTCASETLNTTELLETLYKKGNQ